MSDAFLLEISEQLLRENKKLKGTLSAKYRQGHKAGERQERERVIELLEQEINLYGKDCWIDAIAVIKGVQK